MELTRLDNGMTVITDPVPTFETVSLGVWVKTGSRLEEESINGVAHFLEHMAFKGTTHRTSLEIATAIESVGGYMNAYTSRESTAYYIRLLKENVSLGVEILADILQNPTFPQEDLEKERKVILQEIAQSADTPEDLASDAFMSCAFPQQPLGRPILGTPEHVGSFTRDTIASFMTTHYRPHNLVFSAAGAIEHHALVEQVQKAFSSLTPHTAPQEEGALYKGGEVHQAHSCEQVHALFGFQGPSRHEAHHMPASFLANILGGGMTSRLFQEVREKRGLVYTVQAFSSSYSDSGLFGIYAGTTQDNLHDLTKIVCEQARLPITDEEVERVRTQIKAGFLMSLEALRTRAEHFGNQVLTYKQPYTMDQWIEKIDAVDTHSVRSCADTIFSSQPTVTFLGTFKAPPQYDDICQALH